MGKKRKNRTLELKMGAEIDGLPILTSEFGIFTNSFLLDSGMEEINLNLFSSFTTGKSTFLECNRVVK